MRIRAWPSAWPIDGLVFTTRTGRAIEPRAAHGKIAITMELYTMVPDRTPRVVLKAAQ